MADNAQHNSPDWTEVHSVEMHHNIDFYTLADMETVADLIQEHG